MNSIAAVVVVYNPNVLQVTENIKTYLNQVGEVFVVDNSDSNSLFEPFDDRITMISLRGNKGIAYALNEGVKNAQSKGYHWLITFDQDSKADQNMVQKMSEVAFDTNINNVAIVAPVVSLFDGHIPHTDNQTVIEKNGVLTSGSLCLISAWEKIGGFCEKLFIDWVDIEFCMRLRQHGYKIIELQNVVLQHQLGETKEIKLFGKHLAFITNHNYIRRYYATRNAIYIYNTYINIFPSEAKNIKASILKSKIKIALLEDHKLKKFRAIKIALKDAKNNIFDKIDPTKL